MSESINKLALKKWLEVTPVGERKKFVGFVDADPVVEGDDFTQVALNTSELGALRGKKARVDVYDSSSSIATPH